MMRIEAFIKAVKGWLNGFVPVAPLVLVAGRQVWVRRGGVDYWGEVVEVNPLAMRVLVAGRGGDATAVGQVWLIEWAEVVGYRPEAALPVMVVDQA
jgi:hypothetical protein